MPVALFKGTRRRILQKLKRTLQDVEKMDTRETNKAAKLDVQPDVFFETQPLRNAAQKLTDQVDDLLSRIKK